MPNKYVESYDESDLSWLFSGEAYIGPTKLW